MPESSDELVAHLAVSRGYLTSEQVAEAKDIQRKAAALGLPETLTHIFVAKGMLSQETADALASEASVSTGEARQIGEYTVVQKLGQGGMGAVYLARHKATGEEVALKILPPSMADEDMISRFKREAVAASKLNHGNIVRYVEFGFDEKRRVYFCALEYIDGEDVCERLSRDGSIPEEEAVEIAYHIADALQHAYKNGLVHRDIKPENIMISKSGMPKLLDLGLARHTAETSTRLTQQGYFVGSPMYASPEQARGEVELDTRSDIYSLGATLYDMLTGQALFDDENSMALLQKQLSDRAPWPADLNPKLSDGICRVLAKMLAKDPDDRYAYPIELMGDLRRLKQGEKPKLEPGFLKTTSLLAPDGTSVPPTRRRRRPRKGQSTRSSRKRSTTRGTRQSKVGGKPLKSSGTSSAIVLIGTIGGLAAAVILLALATSNDADMNAPPTQLQRPLPPSVGPLPSPSVNGPALDGGAPQPTASTRTEAGRTAGSALAFARTHEEKYPTDWKTSVALYGEVMADFPGTPEAGLAQISIIRIKAQHTPMERRTSTFETIWEVDPEDKMPDGWRAAGLETTDLPPGSRGAVRQDTRGISIKPQWEDGLFPVEHGLRFNCVLKQGRPGWFQFMLSTHTSAEVADSSNAFWHIARQPRIGEWVTLSAPIEDFNRGQPVRFGGRAWNLALDTGANGDLEILIDKMWVDRPQKKATRARDAGLPQRYRLYHEALTWENARAFCERQGGHLVTISSDAEMRHVLSLLDGAKLDVWIGLSDRREEGTFEWVTGEQLVFTNWGNGEPNNTDEREDYVHISIYADHNLAWNDNHEQVAFSFICEFEDIAPPHGP